MTHPFPTRRSSDLCAETVFAISWSIPMFRYTPNKGLPRAAFDDVSKLRALANDLEGIAKGILPAPDVLASAPFLDGYCFAPREYLSMCGTVHDHPLLSAPIVTTSELWLLAPSLSWDRTSRRSCRLGTELLAEGLSRTVKQ